MKTLLALALDAIRICRGLCRLNAIRFEITRKRIDTLNQVLSIAINSGALNPEINAKLQSLLDRDLSISVGFGAEMEGQQQALQVEFTKVADFISSCLAGRTDPRS